MQILKIISSILLLGFTALCLVFRDSLIFGTALICGRWFLMFFLVLSYFWNKKHLILYSIFAGFILIEWSYVQINKYSEQEIVKKSTAELRIMNHNLLFISQPKQKYIDSILELKPDIIAFQEFSEVWNLYLKKKLIKTYPYHKVAPHHNDAYGFALYSKYPIKSCAYLEEYVGIPYCQVVEVSVKGKKIKIFNTHLDSPAIAIYGSGEFFDLLFQNHERRNSQYKTILEKSNEDSTQTQIFIGDLNTLPYEPLFQKIEQNWLNVSKNRNGSSYSFKTNKTKPFIAIDHVLYKNNLKCTSSEIHDFGNSDHLPVISDFELVN